MTLTIQEPWIETRDAFTAVGLTARGTADALDIGALWDAFVERATEFGPLSVAREAFGVAYDFDPDTDAFTYLAGVALALDPAGSVPADATTVDVPAGTYAVFETTLETVGWMMGAIYTEWLPASGYDRADGPEFERYGDDFDAEANPTFEVWIPVREA